MEPLLMTYSRSLTTFFALASYRIQDQLCFGIANIRFNFLYYSQRCPDIRPPDNHPMLHYASASVVWVARGIQPNNTGGADVRGRDCPHFTPNLHTYIPFCILVTLLT